MGRVSERARAASASAATQLQKSSASASAAAARAAGRGVDTKAPTRVGFLGVARDRKLLLASRDATAKKAKGVSPEGAKQLREVLEREIAAANSSARLHEVANQVEEVRAIMEKNVEMILDRGEQLESLDAKSEDLSTATGMFRKQARKLKRWHLMNQVKYGLAVGTIVTASVAVPIAILVAA
ncbi:hypothetical protein JL722_6338 [Aureococcus anophagefferens]|nr:hypothetical protein JL722_6338 [Aureococcus anophagefferens]